MTTQATKTAQTAVTSTAVQNYFSRKIGNTTFVVSVSFNETTKESMDDKILRLVASEIQKGEIVQCG